MKITVNELKGQEIIDFEKKDGKLILNIKNFGNRIVACDKCGNTDFFPNRNLKECPCGTKFFVFIR